MQVGQHVYRLGSEKLKRVQCLTGAKNHLVIMPDADKEQAIELINDSPCGNGTSIFTASGGAVRKFQHEVQAGQVGINIPIPVLLPFFSFTGWKNSFYGDQHAYGKQAVRFYTETKTITGRWFGTDSGSGTDSRTDSTSEPNMTIKLK